MMSDLKKLPYSTPEGESYPQLGQVFSSQGRRKLCYLDPAFRLTGRVEVLSNSGFEFRRAWLGPHLLGKAGLPARLLRFTY